MNRIYSIVVILVLVSSLVSSQIDSGMNIGYRIERTEAGDYGIRIYPEIDFEGIYFVYGITTNPITLERNNRIPMNDWIPLNRFDLRAGEMYIVIQQNERENVTSQSTKFIPNAFAISQYSYPASQCALTVKITIVGSTGVIDSLYRERVQFTGYFIAPFDHSGRTQILRIVDANNGDFECSNPIELRGNSDFPSTGSSLKRISCELPPGPCRDTTFLFVGQDSNSRGTPFNFYCQDPNIKC
ncbi:hypothetical protein DLAC_06325 [Tieghemostelium lacteum]|uniref:Uncharacterized protein n=1 Tax=Tieghemostelium lacteum TaxID=361077 RepID=A0A151ZEI4_TIELA|nr:hypothetical protein DLAC_06325 [Tieghemostelium lacteum]|eukprot:KYQ92361.1 hypothetical protein DLAC_06325 [Tieghemostelium lacteum]